MQQPIITVLASRLRVAAEYLWGYFGTVSAVALLLGVMAMGVHHTLTSGDSEMQLMRCYAGVFNSAGPEQPKGISLLGDARADSLPLAHVRFCCDENGQIQSLMHIRADGRVAEFPGSRVAEQRLEYDEAGRICRKSNFSAEGAPVPDASGVAVREYAYNSAGQKVRTSFFNAAGKRIVPRMPGYAEQRIEYDEAGRPLIVRHCDADGHPICNVLGEETLEYEYDDVHGIAVRRNHVKGKLAENIYGVAQERAEKTLDGSTFRRSWLDAAGEPVHNPMAGAAAVLEEQSAIPGVQRRLLCGTDGMKSRGERTVAEHLQRCNREGCLEWECWNAADGLPSVEPRLGYAERVCEYSPAGHLQREYFWDASGNPATCYRRDHADTKDGNFVLSHFTDGSTEWRQE